MEESSKLEIPNHTLNSRLCKHCKLRVRQKRKRELCNHCYTNLTIRILYPSGKTLRRLEYLSKEDEPTEEELDVLIEEQRKCLPDWWDEEERRQMQRYKTWGKWWEHDEE